MRTASLRLVPLLAITAALAACAGKTEPREAEPADVTAEDFRNPGEPIERALQRKVPGLVVSRNSNGEIVLQVRGSSSYTGADTPPLYVVDGLPFSPGPGGALTGINPEDIATIKVLKGPETVIYGIDGANGVIVITTKRAKKQ